MKVEFSMNIDSGNAAFEDDPEAEVAGIIRAVEQAVRAGREGGICRDSNGNKVGEWALTIDDEGEEDEQ